MWHCNVLSLRCVDTSWNVMAHDGAREGKWRGNWRMECVASTVHTTSEHGVSSITTADAHISAASSRLNWRPCQFKWTRPFRRKTKPGFCACAFTFQLASTTVCLSLILPRTLPWRWRQWDSLKRLCAPAICINPHVRSMSHRREKLTCSPNLLFLFLFFSFGGYCISFRPEFLWMMFPADVFVVIVERR